MKRVIGWMLGAGMLVPLMISAQPAPERAVEALRLDDATEARVLAVFAEAKTRHDALRDTLRTQHAENDEAFCAIRRDTRGALAKLLDEAQLRQLDEAMRPPRREGRGRHGGPRREGGPTGHGGPGAMAGSPGPGRGPGERPPPPPRCDQDAEGEPDQATTPAR